MVSRPDQLAGHIPGDPIPRGGCARDDLNGSESYRGERAPEDNGCGMHSARSLRQNANPKARTPRRPLVRRVASRMLRFVVTHQTNRIALGILHERHPFVRPGRAQAVVLVAEDDLRLGDDLRAISAQ
jgi:hypothetical protein